MNVTIIPVGMLGTNCYLLASKQKNCVVIDPGAQPEKIAGHLEQEKLTPKMILLTHGHHDHIGGVNKLLELFPGLSVYIGREDLAMLRDTEKNRAAYRYDELSEYIIQHGEAIDEGWEQELDELKLRAIQTPGHTRGGMIYLCNDAMFSGDTLFYHNCGRCDLYGGDYSMMLQSLKRLANLEGDYIVYPGHGETSTLEEERKYNRYMGEACS